MLSAKFKAWIYSPMQGVESGVEDTIREYRGHLAESVDSVTSLVGRLFLARRHYNGFILQSLPQPLRVDVFHEISDEFISIEVSSN